MFCLSTVCRMVPAAIIAQYFGYMNALPGNLHMTDLMPSLLRDSTNFLHCVVLPHRSHPSNTIRAPRFAIADILMFCLSLEIWRPVSISPSDSTSCKRRLAGENGPVGMIFYPARRRLHNVSVAKSSSPKVLKSEGSQVRKSFIK